VDILGLLSGALAQVWYIVPLLLIVSIFNSRWFKGMFGEFLVNRLLSQLSESDYTLGVKDGVRSCLLHLHFKLTFYW